jgi:hypothetical protein
VVEPISIPKKYFFFITLFIIFFVLKCSAAISFAAKNLYYTSRILIIKLKLAVEIIEIVDFTNELCNFKKLSKFDLF